MTFEKIAKEIKTPWEGAWAPILNKEVGPKLKGIRFEKYEEIEGLPGSQVLVKIVLEASPDYFKNTLKTGKLDTVTLMARLEGWIVHDWGFQLFKSPPTQLEVKE